MENNVAKRKPIAIAAAIIFGLLAFGALADIVNNLYYYFNYGAYLEFVTVAIELAAYLLVLFGLVLADKQTLAVIGACLKAVVVVFYFFAGFAWNRYSVYTYEFWYDGKYSFNLFCMMPALIEVLAYIGFAFLIVVACTDKFAGLKEEVKGLWFVPTVVLAASFVIGILVSLVVSEWYGGYGIFSFDNFMMLAGFATAAIALLCPEGFDKKTQAFYINEEGEEVPLENQHVNQPMEYPEGYYGIAKHVVLLLFTFGIWNLIWIYKTTNFLNSAKDEPQRGATAQLLLCMFVPFYVIYWIYVSAQRIDKMALQKGVDSDITVICLLFAIFCYILAPVFMQDKINSIVTVGRKPAAYTNVAEEDGFDDIDDDQEYEEIVEDTYEKSAETLEPMDKPDDSPVQDSVAGARKVAEELKIYKELVDSGVITQEDFEAKKKQLLGI